MKEPKRVQKALESLEKMVVEYLHFYMGGDCPEFRNIVRVELVNIEELLRELAVDQKLQNIRLAKKLKTLWDRNDKKNNIKN